LASPINADVAEKPILNRVPFGATWRIVTDSDSQSESITQFFLKIVLPGPEVVPVGATSVGKNQQTIGLRIGRPAVKPPPTFQAIDGKFRSIVGYSDRNIPGILAKVVDAEGNRHTFRVAGVMRISFLWFSTPTFSLALEISYELFLFGINTDDRQSLAEVPGFEGRDVLKLFVSVRMLRSRLLFPPIYP
jgi:hypothetical protein